MLSVYLQSLLAFTFAKVKKLRVYIIIIILSAALIGLIFVQSILIRQGLNLQAQLFDQIVGEAMMRSAFHIEQNEAKNFFSSYSKIGQLFSKSLSEGNYNESFSLNFENGLYRAEVTQNDSVFVFEADNLQLLDSIMSLSQVCVSLLPKGSGNDNQMLSNYNDLFQEMAYQFLFGADENKLSIDSNELSKILSYELKRSGIDAKFDYALLDGFSYKKLFSNLDKINADIYRKSYKTPVRLNSLSSGHGILIVNFPQKNYFIFQSNKQLLVWSICFILLIAGSFSASIYIIFRQKQLSELKTDFINNMTHELKTPVATISLATEMLKKEKVLNDKARIANYTEIINEENKRLGNNIEKVLQVAQLDKEETRIQKEVFDLNEVLDDVIKKFQLRFEDNNATVSYNKYANNTLVFGDKIHISNVFSNLIDNALKYRRDEDLCIDINTFNKQDSIVVSIKDNGIGMSKSNLKKIFTQFYRIPTGNIHNVKGFGLGLSYVKSMIGTHNGTVDVDSELGEFTLFTIKLPLHNY